LLATCQIFHGGTLRRYVGTQPWQKATPPPPTITNSGPPPSIAADPPILHQSSATGGVAAGSMGAEENGGGNRDCSVGGSGGGCRDAILGRANVRAKERAEGSKGRRGADNGPARTRRQDRQSGKEGGKGGGVGRPTVLWRRVGGRRWQEAWGGVRGGGVQHERVRHERVRHVGVQEHVRLTLRYDGCNDGLGADGGNDTIPTSSSVKRKSTEMRNARQRLNSIRLDDKGGAVDITVNSVVINLFHRPQWTREIHCGAPIPARWMRTPSSCCRRPCPPLCL
jgi:hypothetical protein